MMKKCSRCSKPSTLHITELRDGVVQELHLCETCAHEYLSHPDDEDSSENTDMLSQKLAEVTTEEELEELDQHVCPSCGITFREFRSQGRLGCPDDYIAFERELMPLLENIHGETQHTGKCPKRAPGASQQHYHLIKLQKELQSAVEDEDYETAAGLRDQIQALETELENEGSTGGS